MCESCHSARYVRLIQTDVHTYLVIQIFAHEGLGNVRRHDVLQEELVDVLHGLHLVSFCLEATIQQEIYTAVQLILREKQRDEI